MCSYLSFSSRYVVPLMDARKPEVERRRRLLRVAPIAPIKQPTLRFRRYFSGDYTRSCVIFEPNTVSCHFFICKHKRYSWTTDRRLKGPLNGAIDQSRLAICLAKNGALAGTLLLAAESQPRPGGINKTSIGVNFGRAIRCQRHPAHSSQVRRINYRRNFAYAIRIVASLAV